MLPPAEPHELLMIQNACRAVPRTSPAELPPGLGRLSFVWERGSKLLVTDPVPVNPHTRACFWQQQLRQVDTRHAGQCAAGAALQAASGLDGLAHRLEQPRRPTHPASDHNSVPPGGRCVCP
jgi:hypothetical protein